MGSQLIFRKFHRGQISPVYDNGLNFDQITVRSFTGMALAEKGEVSCAEGGSMMLYAHLYTGSRNDVTQNVFVVAG